MDAAHQWHESLSVIGIHFADSVPEGEAVWMIECGAMVVSFAERALMQPLPDASAKRRLGLKLSRGCPSQLDFNCFVRQNRNGGRAVTMEHEHAKGCTDGFAHKLFRAEYDWLRPTPMAELFCSCNNNHVRKIDPFGNGLKILYRYMYPQVKELMIWLTKVKRLLSSNS